LALTADSLFDRKLKRTGGEIVLTFKKVAEEDLHLLLEWRTSEHVTKFMYTDIEKNMDNQKRWFRFISQDCTQCNWVIHYNDHPIGLISLSQIDLRNKRAALGFYIGDLNYSIIAGRIHPYLYNFAFFELGLNKLCAEVMSGNDGIMKMHLFYGFAHTATFAEHIWKHDRFYDVEYFELLSSTWKEKKSKFHKYTAQFAL
jgi:UDP-4-amino-4,6-dideoxy-N-acetyl-beta-L-altrosamine N-acetyltransferase